MIENSHYSDVDFEEKIIWVINKWKDCPDCTFMKEIQMPTNLFQLTTYKDISSNLKISVFISHCTFPFPIQITFIIYNHLNSDYNIQNTYRFIFTPSYQFFTFEFNLKQKDIISNKGFLDENDSLKIGITFNHQLSQIHPTIQPETPQIAGLLEDKSSFHFNSFLITLFYIPKFRYTVFQTLVNENSPALYLQQLFSLLQFHSDPTTEISSQNFMKSLNFTQSDFNNPDILSLGVRFFKKIKPIPQSLFEGSKILYQKCKNVDFSIKKNLSFFGFSLTNEFDDLEKSLNDLHEKHQKKNIEIDTEEFGLQEAEEYTVITHFPSILFIDLNRFYPDYVNSQNKNEKRYLKKKSFFSFNTSIDVKPFLQDQYENSELEQNPNNSSDLKSTVYYLVGIMTHSGTSFEDGNFSCYIRNHSQFEFNKWLLFNNNKVFYASDEQAIHFNSGNDDDSAYVLIYSRDKLFDDGTEEIPESISMYSSSYLSEIKNRLQISVENKTIYKFTLITPNLVESNGSRGKLSFEESNLFLYIKPKSTLNDLYEKASEVLHIDESKFTLWIVENENFIRNKIERTEKVEVDELIKRTHTNIFVQYLGQETDGDSIFLVFTYFQPLIPAIRLMFTIAQSGESTLNDLFEEYCDITHCELSARFSLSYRVKDHEIKKIEEDKYDMKIKDIPELSSILIIQPNNTSNIFVLIRPTNFQYYNTNEYSNVINYIDSFKMAAPYTIDDFLAMTSNMKTIQIIQPPPTSKITTSEISRLFCFPLMITYDNFKIFVASSFNHNCIMYPNICFLFFPELSTKPLDYENSSNVVLMNDFFQKADFKKLYFYSFPYVNISCMINVSRIILVRQNNQEVITHFFRDDMPIYKVIEYAYQKKWINPKEPNTLVYHKKKNKLIKCQVDPSSLVINVRNPIYFCSFLNGNYEFNFNDILIPVEYIKTNNSSGNVVEQNFMLKIIPEEAFHATLNRLQDIHGALPQNCQFKIYNKKLGEVELEQESVLSYEKDIVLRIYSL